MGKFTERRRVLRAAFRDEVVVSTGSRRFVCRAVDVGVGGICLEADLAPEPGLVARLTFKLEPEDRRRIDEDAILMRVGDRFGHRVWGLRFLGLEPRNRRRIERYVQRPRMVSSGHGPRPRPVAQPRGAPSGRAATRSAQATKTAAARDAELAELYQLALKGRE